jgi:hypothetical protein
MTVTDEQGPSASHRLNGSCHCGNIRLVVHWPVAGQPIPVRACGCSHGQKHRAVWTSHPEGSFRLSVTDPMRVNCYRFGTRTADFHVCTTCGVVPIATCEIGGARYAVVNANTFDDVSRSEVQQTATDFEGESTEARLARRRRNWMPEAR